MKALADLPAPKCRNGPVQLFCNSLDAVRTRDERFELPSGSSPTQRHIDPAAHPVRLHERRLQVVQGILHGLWRWSVETWLG